MKAVIYSAFIITLPFLSLAEYDESAFAQLIRNGAVAKYVYRVVDDEGVPVSNATAHVRFSSYARPQDNADWRIDTDTNGIFVAEHRLNEKFTVGIGKAGYYRTYDKIDYFGMSAEERLSKVKDGKWQPYGETRTVVLKKIRNPIMMRGAPSYVDFKIPVYDKWLGFDFDNNQFVSPYGNGRYSDVLLRFTLKTAAHNDYHMKMEISFTNQLFAGAYNMKKDLKSEMASVYFADKKAAFTQLITYQYDRPATSCDVVEKLCADEYLVFRTRTEVDDKGNLVAARYGKIYGPWHYVGPRGMSICGVFFNPTPNDTNLEDAETARLSRLGYKQNLEFEQQRKAGGK